MPYDPGALAAGTLVVRIGGLPATALKGFSSPTCVAALDRRRAAEEALGKARDELVEKLFPVIPYCAPAERRLVLRVKRDAFNGRSLDKHKEHADWGRIERLGGEHLRQVLELEADLAREDAAFEASFDAELARQREHLRGLLATPELMRGLALASAHLKLGIDRLLARGAAPYGRKERGIERSLLRYVSRAAVKLSPFSALTPVALGGAQVGGELPEHRSHLKAGPWTARSLLRFKRYLLDQVLAALLSCPSFRARSKVVRNPTNRELDDGSLRSIRPGFWAADESGESFVYHQDAVIKLAAEAGVRPIYDRVVSVLTEEAWTYGELADELGAPMSEPAGRPAADLDRLLALGLLVFDMPWSSNEIYLEKALEAHLEGLVRNGAEELRRSWELITRLRHLQESFPTSAAAFEAVDELHGAFDDLWNEVTSLGAVPQEARARKFRRGAFYDDVFLEPEGRRGAPLVRFDRPRLEKVVAETRPLEALGDLLHPRTDFLLSLAEEMRRRFPARACVPFLDVFAETQGLWREYLRYLKASKGKISRVFNPHALAALERLGELRKYVWNQQKRWTRRREDGLEICSSTLEEMLRELPREWRSPVGSCLFAQPVEGERLWVLNQSNEGTGRWESRFTGVLGAAAADLIANRREAAEVELEGERFELVDVLCAQGDTLNVHRPMTPRVIEVDGSTRDRPPEDRYQLGELFVELPDLQSCGRDALPRIRHASGSLLLPVHLGGASVNFMPLSVRYLTRFGPTDRLFGYPQRSVREEAGARVLDRLWIGDVVLMRKRWSLPVTASEIEGLGCAERFRWAQELRRRFALPDRIFVMEPLEHRVHGLRYKPQYVDLTSPLYVTVLTDALEADGKGLTVEEALPDLDQLVESADGEVRAVELQLDEVAIAPSRENRSPVSPETVTTSPARRKAAG